MKRGDLAFLPEVNFEMSLFGVDRPPTPYPTGIQTDFVGSRDTNLSRGRSRTK